MEIIVVLGIIVLISSLFSNNGKDKSNCCPDCGKPSLEVKRTVFLGKEYLKCSRFFCSWDSRTNHTNHYRERKEQGRAQRAEEARIQRQVHDDAQQYRIWSAMSQDD